jgi:hypothetical protein
MGLPHEMLRPVLLAGALLGLMSVVDTLAYGVRTAGVLTRKLAISLSLFNILVVISRLSNMFSAPILGNFPDKVYQGVYTPAQVQVGLRADLLFVVAGVICGALLMPTYIRMFQRGIQLLEQLGTLPRTLTYGLRRIGHLRRYLAVPKLSYLSVYSDFRVLPYQVLVYNIFVTCFYSIGVMSTVLAASLDHSVAGTAILLSGIVNGIATMTLFIIVDPPAAVVVENCITGKRPVSHAKIMNVTLVITRLTGCLLALLLLPIMSQYVLAAAHWVDRAFSSGKAVLHGEASAKCNGLDYQFKLVEQPTGGYLLELSVHNNTSEAHEMAFASAARYEFSVRLNASVVWRSSQGLRFTQALENETLGAHRSVVYKSHWPGALPSAGRGQRLQVQVEARHLLIPEPVVLQFSTSLLPSRADQAAGVAGAGEND